MDEPLGAAVVAPAGHGKTEEIVREVALGGRSLVLTHTHAGVHAIKQRLKRHGVSAGLAAVDTIAGWAMRYANAFPGHATPPNGFPANAEEWTQLYDGLLKVMALGPVRDVISCSYDRVLIDEYQDCTQEQHRIAVALAAHVDTTVFGDPMQGIFEFAGGNLDWPGQVHASFPLVKELHQPHRWNSTNPELGAWIAETRQRLLDGETIDLQSGPIEFVAARGAFDPAVLFAKIDEHDGSVAAIHCRRGTCDGLAKMSRGAYQAIEEIAAKRLIQFARQWDAGEGTQRVDAIRALFRDCCHRYAEEVGGSEEPESSDRELERQMTEETDRISQFGDAQAARALLSLARRHSKWRLFRSELWRDAERALTEVAAGRADSLTAAATAIRQRTSLIGRQLPNRTVSTPLLLKGLEFDHVVIPDATHFLREDMAQAKLFYVAISRARRSLTIASSERYLRFPAPTGVSK